MRKYIIIAIGIAIILVAVLLVQKMIEINKKPEKKANKIVKTVYVDIVKNTDIPIVISANGHLVAKNKIEIFSEVQGVLQITAKEFKTGTSYGKGETILKINNEEHLANLQSKKSKLFNSITSVMPDLRLDYPNEFQKWQQYLTNFNFTRPTPKLPEATSEKEKFFISGRNIYTTYYDLKNMEVRLNKYNIKAPYKGILTEAFVNPGSLVRPGQKLGEYINPSIYEMEVAINANYIDILQIGNPVELHNLDNTKTWNGFIIRVNGKIDQESQTAKVFIQVKSNDLMEGMYLEALLVAKSEKNCYEVDRKLLVNNESVFILNDSVLDLVKVNSVHFKHNTVVIKGLKDGTKILSKIVPGSYDGMKVKIFNKNQANQ